MPKRRPSKGDYAVGYGRPPAATQFKPGQSGNSKGRPKGGRSVSVVVRDVMQRKVPVTENGKTRHLSVLEVVTRRIANDAMRGDANAIKLVLSLYERYAEAPEMSAQLDELLVEDREILNRYLFDPNSPTSASATEGVDDDL